MRTLVALLALAILPLAGCLEGSDPAADAEPTAPSPQAPAPIHPEGTPEFCVDEDTCTFWDEDFHEFVVYDLDTTVIDVLIVPPAGNAVDGIAASQMAVQAWEDGIRAFAAPWFNDSFEMNVYVVGVDVPDASAVQDPEIVVLTASAAPSTIVGIGLEPKQLACAVLADGGDARELYPVHSHDGMSIVAADCTGTGFTCFANNVGAALDMINLYDLIAHEVGHCLGGGHVGDALDFSARYAPTEDIMSYQNNATQVHCVSNLNVRVLEGVYAHLLEQPEELWLPRGSFYAMSPLDYERTTCANPA
ncbi:MAG: reprolysin-like metallopeptidase [Candidatus Thermoplasmatota archaeon]|jgi:hypothetical protein